MSRSESESAKEGHDFDLNLLLFHLRNVSPFFGSLALFSEHVCTEKIETAATDGRRLMFNPRFMEKHRLDEQLGIFVHELLHAALRHVERRAEAHPVTWNIAADIVVNGIIDGTHGLVLPRSAVRRAEWADFPVEEVYQLLLQEGGEWTRIPLLGGDLVEIEEEPGENLGDHWNGALAQASVISRIGGLQKGDLPANLLRAIREATDPPLDWRTLLWRHLTRTPVDFTAFDRRFIGEDLYLDAMDGETVRVAVCVDTSGSIGEELLSRFLTEVRAILAAYPSTVVDFYSCDTELHGPSTLDSTEVAMPELRGGGGTSFEPFFEALKAANPPPDTAVYLTDGFGDFPKKAPSFPTLWVITPGGMQEDHFPFGETARMRSS